MDLTTKSPEDWRTGALQYLVSRIDYDHYVWGAGKAEPDGSLLIDELLSTCSFSTPGFIRGYNTDYASQDVIGRLHMARPELVLVWSAVGPSMSPRKPYSARHMASYLDSDRHIEHLLLVGMHTSRGRAWLTLYRTGSAHRQEFKKPFTRGEVEFARHAVPFFLLGWQERLGEGDLSAEQCAYRASMATSQPGTALTVLTPYDLCVILAFASEADTAHVVKKIAPAFPNKVSLKRPEEAVRTAYKRALAKLKDYGMTEQEFHHIFGHAPRW